MLSKIAGETVYCLVLVLLSPSFLLSENCGKSMTIRRANVFVLLVFMLILMTQVFSLALAAFVLLFMPMSL